MTRARLLAAIVMVGFTMAGVAAQQQQPRPRIPPTGQIKNVRDNLYVIPGAGGNTTVFVTQSGIVLVDTKLANNGEAILSQVRTVSGRAVTMIVNTHSHPDHIGSNDYFPATVEKVTHENTKKSMEANPRVASNPAVMPTKTLLRIFIFLPEVIEQHEGQLPVRSDQSFQPVISSLEGACRAVVGGKST